MRPIFRPRLMKPVALWSLALLAATSLAGAEPQELTVEKKKFGQISRPTEAQRQKYILGLAELRSRYAKADRTEDWQAVDAEILRHPSPANTKAYTKLMPGEWVSPRHAYIYRADGTWCMLPEEPGVTHGRWRIEGNQFLDISGGAEDPEKEYRFTIILLTKSKFIFGDNDSVFYENRYDD